MWHTNPGIRIGRTIWWTDRWGWEHWMQLDTCIWRTGMNRVFCTWSEERQILLKIRTTRSTRYDLRVENLSAWRVGIKALLLICPVKAVVRTLKSMGRHGCFVPSQSGLSNGEGFDGNICRLLCLKRVKSLLPNHCFCVRLCTTGWTRTERRHSWALGDSFR
jgi:hypothetical protein